MLRRQASTIGLAGGEPSEAVAGGAGASSATVTPTVVFGEDVLWHVDAAADVDDRRLQRLGSIDATPRLTSKMPQQLQIPMQGMK